MRFLNKPMLPASFCGRPITPHSPGKLMFITKRNFLKASAATIGAGIFVTGRTTRSAVSTADQLTPITGDAKAITVAERLERIAKAQKLMAHHGIDALLLEPGSAMLYFTGIRWWRSERLTAVVIPGSGDIGVVTPY